VCYFFIPWLEFRNSPTVKFMHMQPFLPTPLRLPHSDFGNIACMYHFLSNRLLLFLGVFSSLFLCPTHKHSTNKRKMQFCRRHQPLLFNNLSVYKPADHHGHNHSRMKTLQKQRQTSHHIIVLPHHNNYL